MLVVHHLNDSRSQRILWLLEELGTPYEIKRYQRDAHTIAESGAVVDYVLRRYGKGALQPRADRAEFENYAEWLHYAEGSAMLSLMLNLYVGRLGEAGKPLHPRIDSELANHLGYVDAALKGKDWLVGGTLTGADIQMSFVGEMAKVAKRIDPYPNLAAWVSRFQARPAYARSIEKGGTYRFAA